MERQEREFVQVRLSELQSLYARIREAQTLVLDHSASLAMCSLVRAERKAQTLLRGHHVGI